MAPMVNERSSRPGDPIGNLVMGRPVSVSEKLSLRSIAAVLAADEIGAVLVHQGPEMEGIVSERDLVRALADDADPEAIWSVDVMSEPLRTVDRDATILSVAIRMVADDVRHMVVTSDDEVLGVISARDVFRVLTVDAIEAAGAPAP